MRLLSFILFLAALGLAPRPAAALPHQVYVWQRVWSDPVGAAVAAHATNFEETAVLAAEVSWAQQAPQTVRAGVDFPLLARTHCRVGLVLRVGPYNGSLAQDSAAVAYLAQLAGALATEARTNGVEPVELQIDFDCAESKLDDYRVWLTAVQQQVAPLPVTITVLPSWLDAPAFVSLASAATNYVLQVHSLMKPTGLTSPYPLCDPVLARRAVVRAGELGVPFRAALPTYAYIVAFDARGGFIGLSAEAPRAAWPENAVLREMGADPLEMSSLTRFWSTNHPAAMRGVIWYRLPVEGDKLNWHWPTLGAIVAGRQPRQSFHAATRRVEAGLVEISVVNDGDLDLSSRVEVAARWSAARLVAGDGLRGFDLTEPNSSAATLRNQSSDFRLPAGVSLVVGWLRFNDDREVTLEVDAKKL